MSAAGVTPAMPRTAGGAAGAPGPGAEADRLARELRSVERLRQSLHGSAGIRRVFYACSLVFPSIIALLLTFLALYPLCFLPAGRLTATLASMVGAGLSFATVSYTAARVSTDDRGHAMRLATAGSMLVRFAIATAVALALATSRERLAATFGAANVLDLPLRVVTVPVTLAGIGMAFFGFRTLVLLLGPELEEDAAERLRELLARDARMREPGEAPEPMRG